MVHKLNNKKIIDFLIFKKKSNMLSFHQFEDYSEVLVARTSIPHWGRILDVWFLVFVQLSFHLSPVMFSPSLRTGVVLLLKDLVPEQFCLIQNCIGEHLCTLPPPFPAVAMPCSLFCSVGNKGKKSSFNSLYLAYFIRFK